ncbi:probable carbohydrate esterase At4g34215 [Magnolia sinica]|uniref:probable carbohydrate esterase At4g34215 n=1 Tax=Magnolia sinica TaxID=86752 RepID=UPI00265ABCAA|nr:probable carbohydrate esterase At4g34215 [Magnolia sinica]
MEMAESEEGRSNWLEKVIFILSGQSNMAGRGGVTKSKKWDRVVPPECIPSPSILRFTARSTWEEASDPLHADIDTHKTCGVGPGMPFANALRAHRPTIGIVGLVPCAVGGTAIKEWERGSHLYENMVRRAKESVKGGGEIRALLWYQGESDTGSQHAAESYKSHMEKLIQDVRSDLQLPSLPIIQVAIASGDGRFIEKVREEQLGINLPNVTCVDAKGLPLKEDHLHLTTEAQIKLGNMLCDAYIMYFASSCH